jgi:multidrug efflux pump subunit AcrB
MLRHYSASGGSPRAKGRRPLEPRYRFASGINKVRAVSQENFGQVTIEQESGFNADVVLQDVKNAVDGIISFPSGMEPPNVRKMEFTDVAVQFALSGDIDLKLLKQYARSAEDDLRLLNGISKVELSGFPAEEIQISFREDDLQRYDLTLDEAYSVIKNANIDITGGTLRGNSEELRVRARQKNTTPTN